MCLDSLAKDDQHLLWVSFVLLRSRSCWTSSTVMWRGWIAVDSPGWLPTWIRCQTLFLSEWLPRRLASLWGYEVDGTCSASCISSLWRQPAGTVQRHGRGTGGCGDWEVNYFEGTPIPTSIAIVLLLATAFGLGRINDDVWLGAYQLGPAVLHPLTLDLRRKRHSHDQRDAQNTEAVIRSERAMTLESSVGCT